MIPYPPAPNAIQQAPKDGRYIIARDANNAFAVVRWYSPQMADASGNPVTSALAGSRGYWQCYGSAAGFFEPIEWWPLPKTGEQYAFPRDDVANFVNGLVEDIRKSDLIPMSKTETVVSIVRKAWDAWCAPDYDPAAELPFVPEPPTPPAPAYAGNPVDAFMGLLRENFPETAAQLNPDHVAKMRDAVEEIIHVKPAADPRAVVARVVDDDGGLADELDDLSGPGLWHVNAPLRKRVRDAVDMLDCYKFADRNGQIFYADLRKALRLALGV